MDSTNCGSECAFVKSGFIKCDKECPNYIENFWVESGKETPKLIKDCFPKRFTQEQNLIRNQIINVQAAFLETRNRLDNIEHMLKVIIEKSANYLRDEQVGSLDSKEKTLTLEQM